MNNIRCYYTHDRYLNARIAEIREYIEFNKNWLGESFVSGKDWIPSIIYELGSWAECYSSEIPRNNKIIDVYSVIDNNINVICSFYCKDHLVYMEMFYSEYDYNLCEFKKICFVVVV